MQKDTAKLKNLGKLARIGEDSGLFVDGAFTNMVVDFFFCIKSLTALGTHVLSCSGLGGTFSSNDLTQLSHLLKKK